MKFGLKIFIALLVLAPVFTFGQIPIPESEETILSDGLTGIWGFFALIIQWLFTLFLVLAVIFIILAAYNYLFSGGEEDKVKKAHKMLLYAVVAIAVAFLARGIVFAVKTIVAPGLSDPSGPTAPTGTVPDPAPDFEL